MSLTSLQEILKAKAERRRALAALSPTEKVRIMEKLQAMGRTMREARGKMRVPAPERAPISAS